MRVRSVSFISEQTKPLTYPFTGAQYMRQAVLKRFLLAAEEKRMKKELLKEKKQAKTTVKLPLSFQITSPWQPSICLKAFQCPMKEPPYVPDCE